MSRFLRTGLLAASFSLLSGMACADLVFDNITAPRAGTGTVTRTTSTPNTFMGDAYVLATGTTQITGFDLFPYNGTGTTFTNLKLNVFVWGGVNTGAVSASAPAFSNLLGSYSFTSASSTFTSGFYYAFENTVPGSAPALLLNTPLDLPGTTVGITVNVQGTTNGTTYSTLDNLTSLITYGTPPSTGGLVFNGYYRNANSETNGNFTSTLRTVGTNPTNEAIAMRVYGNVTAVPEPGTWALMGLGVMGLLAWRRRQA